MKPTRRDFSIGLTAFLFFAAPGFESIAGAQSCSTPEGWEDALLVLE